MSDHASVIRDYIDAGGYEVVWTTDEAEPERGKQPSIVPRDKELVVAALDALVAERDDWEATARAESDGLMKWYHRAEAAEARVEQLEAALRVAVAMNPVDEWPFGARLNVTEVARAALVSSGSEGAEWGTPATPEEHCGDEQPHSQHEWINGPRRRQCPGSSGSEGAPGECEHGIGLVCPKCGSGPGASGSEGDAAP